MIGVARAELSLNLRLEVSRIVNRTDMNTRALTSVA
jgi:hypothetical protein